jgi:O-antigen/teichoic acid export membrane protein
MKEAQARPDSAAAEPPASLTEPEMLVSTAMGGGGRLLGFRAVQFAFLFLLSLIATRALGPDGRAQYALALNLATMVWVVSHLSVEQSVARMMARKEASRAVGVAATLALGLAEREALLGGAAPTTVILAAATIPFTLIGQMATALLLRMGVLRAYGWTIAVGAVIQFGLIVSLQLGFGLTPELTMLAALLTIAGVAFSLVAVLVRRVGARALSPFCERRLIRAALSTGLRLQPASIALWLNLKIDLFLVGLLATTHEAGLYSLSASLADIVFTAVSTVALAALEAQTKADADAAAGYTVDFIGQNIAVAACLGLLAALVSYPFIVFVYGAEWEASVLPFALLMPAVVALAIEEPARGLLVRIAPPLIISAAAATGLLLNVALNFALVPAIGISGASLASVASYWLAGGLMLFLVSHYGDVPMRAALRLPRRDDALPRLLRRVVG